MPDKREIKFRAWHIEAKKWLNVGNLIDAEKVPVEPCGDTFRLKNGDTVIYLQFTGLRDKNGVEIYEGDILSYKIALDWHNGKPPELIDDVLEVSHKDAAFILTNLTRPNWSLLRVANIKKMSVIGNIYENPELLLKEIETD